MARPERIGLVATLYEQYTMTNLTEALMNVFTNEKAGKNAFNRLSNYMYEWELEVNRIKRLPILERTGEGNDGGDIVLKFAENYYQKYDMFIIESLRQYIQVLNRPQRISDNCYVVVGRLVDSDYSACIPESINLTGATTRFITNNVPELHEEGYTKYQSKLLLL